jgi:hypothetical protein
MDGGRYVTGADQLSRLSAASSFARRASAWANTKLALSKMCRRSSGAGNPRSGKLVQDSVRSGNPRLCTALRSFLRAAFDFCTSPARNLS